MGLKDREFKYQICVVPLIVDVVALVCISSENPLSFFSIVTSTYDFKAK